MVVANREDRTGGPAGGATVGLLCGLAAGEAARVTEVSAGQAAAKRLADMGFVRGAVLEMIRPGRPCLVRIGRTYVGLGFEHQRSVRVERV